MEKYGVCHLAYFPIRKEPDHKAENISVVLFGEHFHIRSINGNWFYIQLEFDGYKGWITSNEIRNISEKEFNEISNAPRFYSNELFQKVNCNDKSILIGLGSTLPFWDKRHFRLANEQYSILGEVVKAKKRKERELIYDLAMRMLEIPYLWGGRNSFGIDCSGFVQTIYKFLDINLPRDASMQRNVGKIIGIENAELGDLAFFTNEAGRTEHVGILIDKNSIIHASGKVRIDTIDKKGIFNNELRQYTHQLEIIKRI